ncbi:unnamed protein product [Periconia digitata]|uniref:Xylose isomerase-like TIM barrel domain-containing protein n=1 Tax=Periconia digitata TaxID=1303443 RepID=A0A9W4URF9_9PLEO|nr:unnamed protein product [Periconia digitata]
MTLLPGISTMSLGRNQAGHTLSHKLHCTAQNGLRGIELFYDDLQALATPPTPSNLLKAATYVHDLCTSLNLTVICLQPFMHYEGLINRVDHAKRIEDMKLWLKLAKALDTDLILVPSSFLGEDECTGDFDTIVSDLREIAELGVSEGVEDGKVIRFMYEGLCWGTHVDTWEVCWDIVQAVDRGNFGICLDSFNILGRIYADPAAVGGKTADAESVVGESMKRMVERITPFKEKIFFVQVVDAEKLREPLQPGHAFYQEGQRARMSWSRNCRLFYGETEEGAYLPVKEVVETIFKKIGYEGWASFEFFNRAMEKKGDGVVEGLAARAGKAWGIMMEDLELVDVRVSRAGLRKDSKDLEEIARL